MRIGRVILYTFLVFIMASCSEEVTKVEPIFKLLEAENTGINFSNDLTYNKDFNVYKYRNFYNGGGVAIGDVNNDGLVDVYLVSNQEDNKLYLNKGNLTFEDITDQSGVKGTKAWSTGVTFVDINQDNHLDIYVCNSGDVNGDNKENELFINNGDMTFTESAEKYNLNDKGYSTHASFFDYDKDGDLDVYILNNSYQAIGSFNLKINARGERDVLGGDKLMRNDNGVFTNVNEEANIYSSVIGFGLGVTVSDFNNDNWQDIFVSNDFFERDYLYINQKDGTFKEDLPSQINSTSAASMGADAADIDNDGNSDLFVTDMLPYEYERLKTVTTFDDWDRYNYNLKNGYHRQFTRNVLQRNNGNGTFSEISRYAGVDASDWSWGALFFDMDNDGLKDLFIANGIYKDLTNQDYLQYVANETVIESIVKKDGVNYKELIDIIPSNKVENQGYINQGNLQFDPDRNTGLWTPSFSNGAAYGDLDNDGDLDLVVNNISMNAFVYENTSDSTKNRYLKVILNEGEPAASSLGAKIKVSTPEMEVFYEYMPTRGFQSTMDPRANIGVGNAETVNVEVIWPSGKVTKMKGVSTNQTLRISESESNGQFKESEDSKKVFTEVDSQVDYVKKENAYVDFNRERLVYHMRSNEGAGVSQGDIDGDGIEDAIIPGAKGHLTEVFLGKEGGGYSKANTAKDFELIKDSEHTNSMLLDVDGDSDLDLYLASGGVEHSAFSSYLDDNLLLNDGQGNFTLAKDALPSSISKISVKGISHSDIDRDGDEDIVIGERVKVGKYGVLGSGFVLINDGTGKYEDKTDELCPKLKNIGMITAVDFEDFDGDGKEDLIVAGEFLAIQVFRNMDGKLVPQELKSNVSLSGWWNNIELADIDNDGDKDIVASNFGENNRFQATENQPLKLFVSDFDHNSFPEGVLAFQAKDGKDYPYGLRHNLIDQMKGLKKQYPDFESFKSASISDIFSPEQLAEATVLSANQLKTVVLENKGNFTFESIELPEEVQFSTMYSSLVYDFDQDGDQDIVFGGNQFSSVPEMGIYDATQGIYLENKGGTNFVYHKDGSGFISKGEIRDLFIQNDVLMVLKSKEALQTFKF